MEPSRRPWGHWGEGGVFSEGLGRLVFLFGDTIFSSTILPLPSMLRGTGRVGPAWSTVLSSAAKFVS